MAAYLVLACIIAATFPSSAYAQKPAGRKPMTKAEVQKLWAQKAQTLFLNELRLRGLAFEPEEDWLAELPKTTKVEAASVPGFADAIRKLIPPAPDVDAVTKQGPDLLAKLKTAAQKRSDADLATIVHPELLAAKARVYDLFDKAAYRNHMLGKFAPSDHRRVGVQFFQLTVDQVERLHYILFATSGGKIVVRDVVTGPQVAELFLRDEQKLAVSKLEQVFRALNDGDQTALKNLATPGLYESLKDHGTLSKGHPPFPQITVTPSVPLDQKSIRVVARVAYPTRSGRKIEYDIDFERIDNDLKVVRLRDVHNDVIAWDPQIDNYLNRRFGLPDGPTVDDVKLSNVYPPLSRIVQLAQSALEDRDAEKLKEYAQLVVDADPGGGDGFGMLAGAHHMLGKYDEAEKAALDAISRGGTAYFAVLRHTAFNREMRQFWPVVLGVSKTKIQYLPPAGQAGATAEEITIGGVEEIEMERGSIIRPARPFLKLKFKPDVKKRDTKDYNFAAFGTTCPDAAAPARGGNLVPFTGGTVCSGTAQQAPPKRGALSIPGTGTSVPMLVPRTWDRDLRVVLRAIEEARSSTATSHDHD
jgi:hypothetical protein